MRRKHHESDHKAANPEAGAQPLEAEALQDELARMSAEDAGLPTSEAEAGSPVAPSDEAIARLEREALEWKDRALRASADFENYRRRAMKEQGEANGRGQAHAFGRIIDVIDDLARVAHLDPASTSAEALHEGMLAIERKFLKTLETAGLERIDPAGQAFDPTTQEAVASLPAPDAAADHTVAAVYQHGYRYRGQLLRPARVAVYQWSGAVPDGPGPDAGPAA